MSSAEKNKTKMDAEDAVDGVWWATVITAFFVWWATVITAFFNVFSIFCV